MTISNICLWLSCSFLHQFLHLVTHGLLFKVLFFLYTASISAAQQGTLSSSAPPTTTDSLYNTQPKFNPSLAVLMIIIVSAFFVMGFFSVYVRRCAEGRYRGSNFNPSANPIGGGGRWSRRAQQGLDAAVIETFPTFLYSAVKGHKMGKDSLECAVCLNEFEEDQTLRLIPKCNHVFHPDCIDAWLASHTTCPVCRANLVPKPGDSIFDSTLLFEPNNNNNSVEPPDQRSNNVCDETQNDDVLIHISDDNEGQNREVPQRESQNVILLNTAIQNRPPRSRSMGWRLGRLFPRSHSTGHSLVQPGENLDRFTLRLPEEVRSQLMNTHLNRTKSCVTFTRAMSSRTGYRRSGSSRNYLNYERFDREGRPDRWGFTMTPPFIGRTGSLRSSKGAGGNDEVNAIPPKNLLKSIKSPIDRLFIGGDNSGSNNNMDERSSDRLRDADVH